MPNLPISVHLKTGIRSWCGLLSSNTTSDLEACTCRRCFNAREAAITGPMSTMLDNIALGGEYSAGLAVGYRHGRWIKRLHSMGLVASIDGGLVLTDVGEELYKEILAVLENEP